MTSRSARTEPEAPPGNSGEPPALHDRAIDNLRFIRETMERAGSFTAVSGAGVTIAGVVAVGAGLIADRQASVTAWTLVWIVAAVVASAIAATLTVRKASSLGPPLLMGPGRKALLAFSPAMVAGAVLTAALIGSGRRDLLAGTWLVLYGAGVTAGGALSVSIIPVLGLLFMALGAAAIATPASFANSWMIAGFGGLHVAFGLAIARRFGG